MSLFFVIFSHSLSVPHTLNAWTISRLLNCHIVEVMIVPVLINHSWKLNKKKRTGQKKRSKNSKRTRLFMWFVHGPASLTCFFMHAPYISLFKLPVYRYILMFNKTINHKAFRILHLFSLSHFKRSLFWLLMGSVFLLHSIEFGHRNETRRMKSFGECEQFVAKWLENGCTKRLANKNLIAMETMFHERKSVNGD